MLFYAAARGMIVIMSNVHITVGDVEAVDIHSLIPWPRNARRGDTETLRASLDEHGQYKPVLAQRSSSHIIAGNNIWHAMANGGTNTIAVQWLDVDDTRADRINLMDNRASDKASYDNTALLEQLEALPDLSGTGYALDDLDDLRAAFEETLDPLTTDTATVGATVTDNPDSNVHQKDSLNDKKASYQLSDQRQIILSYEGAQYVWVIEQLGVLAATYGVESNAATVLKLITAITNEHPPEGGGTW